MTLQRLSERQSVCNWIKFIAALLVVNGHLFLFGNYEGALTRFMDLGACCVSLFFFFSGYGLAYSYEKKGDSYLKSFFKKRFGKILIPLLTAYLITIPLYAAIKGSVNWPMLFKTLYWGGPFLKYSWYVSEILIIYTLFYIAVSLKCFSLRIRLIVLSMLTIAFMALLFLFRQPMWYIISLPGFLIGFWYQYYEEKIIAHTNRRFLLSFLVVSIVIWLFMWQWSSLGKSYLPAYRYDLLAKVMSCAIFPSMIVAFMGTVTITPPNDNNIIVGASYEIYLVQNAAMMVASLFAIDFLEYWVASMAVIVMLACGQHLLDRSMIKMLKLS